jgi:hypothetical protein
MYGCERLLVRFAFKTAPHSNLECSFSKNDASNVMQNTFFDKSEKSRPEEDSPSPAKPTATIFATEQNMKSLI